MEGGTKGRDRFVMYKTADTEAEIWAGKGGVQVLSGVMALDEVVPDVERRVQERGARGGCALG